MNSPTQVFSPKLLWRHNIQHNDIHPNDTQNSNKKMGHFAQWHSEQQDSILSGVMLSVLYDDGCIIIVMLSVVMLNVVVPSVVAPLQQHAQSDNSSIKQSGSEL